MQLLRRKKFILTDSHIIPFLNGKIRLIGKIPEDAEILSCHWDHDFMKLEIVMSHPTFDCNYLGEHIKTETIRDVQTTTKKGL